MKDPKIDSSLFKDLKTGTIHLDNDEEDELPKEDKKKSSEAVLKIKSPAKPLPKESAVKSPAKSPAKSPIKPSPKPSPIKPSPKPSPAKSPVTSSQKKTEEKKVSTQEIPTPSDTPTRVTRSLKRKSEEVKEKPPAKKEKIKKKKETVGVYEVEYIKGKKNINGKVSYHVHWKGYESSDDTWEPIQNIIDKDLIEAFEKKGK